MTKTYSSIVQSKWWAITVLATATGVGSSAQTITHNCGEAAYTAADGSAWVSGQDFSGCETLNWLASANQSWLPVSQASGTGARVLSIQANASGLAAGTYTGTVTVSTPGASGSPKTIAITRAAAAAGCGSSIVNIIISPQAIARSESSKYPSNRMKTDALTKVYAINDLHQQHCLLTDIPLTVDMGLSAAVVAT
jgi:hypothetical protein